MAIFDELEKPLKTDLLICFGDIDNFTSVSKGFKDPLGLFDLMNGWAVLVIRHVADTGGRVIKFIGDSTLIVYPAELADMGTRELLALNEKSKAYFKDRGFPLGMHVGIHFGEAVIGPFGEPPLLNIDVGGHSVNKAAVLAGSAYRGKFVITPQAFRKLKPETRKLFHKFTPPVVYMAE